MLCQKCGQDTAMVHTKANAARKWPARHLCENCAELEYGLPFSKLPSPKSVPIEKPPKTQISRSIVSYHFVTTDKSGKVMDVQADPQPPENTFAPSNPATLKAAAKRLFHSQEQNPALLVVARINDGGNPAMISLHHRSAQTLLSVTITSHNAPKNEALVEKFFSDRSIELVRDAGKVTPFGARNLQYAVAASAPKAANLIGELLRIVYGVAEDERVRLSFVRC
jgi:hypothetical protein